MMIQSSPHRGPDWVEIHHRWHLQHLQKVTSRKHCPDLIIFSFQVGAILLIKMKFHFLHVPLMEMIGPSPPESTKKEISLKYKLGALFMLFQKMNDIRKLKDSQSKSSLDVGNQKGRCITIEVLNQYKGTDIEDMVNAFSRAFCDEK